MSRESFNMRVILEQVKHSLDQDRRNHPGGDHGFVVYNLLSVVDALLDNSCCCNIPAPSCPPRCPCCGQVKI